MPIRYYRQDSRGCSFCKKNREPPSVYATHQMTDSEGRVTCPTLFAYRCELCGATGSEAHTRSYCPIAKDLLKTSRRQGRNEPAHGQTERYALEKQRQPQQQPQSGQQQLQQQQQQQQPQQQQRSQDPQPGTEPELKLQLNTTRRFQNMGRVSNSRYNSAGKRR